jgi:NADP-dependent 3-hydroxy acid dehydrogenase YdfG
MASETVTFKDQAAVITGASSGIGRAIALGLAVEGATLCLVGRRLETLEAVAEIARRTGSNVFCYRADLAIHEDVQNLAASLQHDFKSIDMLIHSAGAIRLGRHESAPVEDLDWHYRINVRAPYALTQALLPMLKSRRGQIVFINSSAAQSAGANASQYAATKAALKAIADSLRVEINAEGVRVLSIYPGRTASPMQASVHKMEGKTYYPERLMQPADVAMVVINALSLPRSAEVTDINIRPMVKSF